MSIDVPDLDNRKFQDLVDEAKRRIPGYAPEWTDHNVSVPTATGSHYDGQLSVSLRLDPFWSFHHFGAECGGRLRGVLPGPSGSQFGLNLTGAAPHVPALLAVGPRMRTPIQLPGSLCLLHINPLVAVGWEIWNSRSTTAA